MPVWLVRAGAHGEFEEKFLTENRVYVTWDGLDVDLSRLPDREALRVALSERFPDAKPKTVLNWVSQIWPFAHEIAVGDLVVTPLKTQRAIQIGEFTGGYHFEPSGPNPFFHWRPVTWVGDAIPRSHFGQDLLYSFGAFMTLCRIQRNNAEERIRTMRVRNWQPETLVAVAGADPAPATGQPEQSTDSEESIDLEEAARDQIARLIEARFKGHALTRLVEGILRAQGYLTWRSPEGSDGGADILAGAGPLGFGQPRLVVEVKSESGPIDRPTVDKLIGAVTKFGAQEGLFVAWGGYRRNVQKELAASFFRVRLWSQSELLEALFKHYQDLDDDLKAELPLKRIWSVALQED
ncbi:MAG: restriction endonuclease [Acidobacteria bacterium]|nr:MAG: restriction endonuclease [Acidobacteriota bacterium]